MAINGQVLQVTINAERQVELGRIEWGGGVGVVSEYKKLKGINRQHLK